MNNNLRFSFGFSYRFKLQISKKSHVFHSLPFLPPKKEGNQCLKANKFNSPMHFNRSWMLQKEKEEENFLLRQNIHWNNVKNAQCPRSQWSLPIYDDHERVIFTHDSVQSRPLPEFSSALYDDPHPPTAILKWPEIINNISFVHQLFGCACFCYVAYFDAHFYYYLLLLWILLLLWMRIHQWQQLRAERNGFIFSFRIVLFCFSFGFNSTIHNKLKHINVSIKIKVKQRGKEAQTSGLCFRSISTEKSIDFVAHIIFVPFSSFFGLVLLYFIFDILRIRREEKSQEIFLNFPSI